MKHSTRIVLLLMFICSTNIGMSQSSNPFAAPFRAYDTNGPMGKCLFQTDDKGEIVYQAVVETNYSKEEQKKLAERFFEIIDKEDIYDVRLVQNEKDFAFDYDVNVSSGRQRVNVNVATWERDRSTVRCHVKLEFKEGRYRYTVNPYETNRQTIRGEAKSDGHPNILHWQRVNSLTKERAADKKKKYDEYTKQIQEENNCYQAEYSAIQAFIKLLASYCVYVESVDKEADF